MSDETKPETAPPTQSNEPGPVPYGRFSEVVAARDAHATRISELEAKVAELNGQVETHQKAASEWALDRDCYKHGFVEDEARDLARFMHSRHGGEQPFGEWLEAQVNAPDSAPKALRPYMPQAVPVAEVAPSAPDPTQAQTVTPPQPPSAPNKGTAPAPDPDAVQLDPDAIAKMSTDEYKAQRERMLARYKDMRS